MMLSPLRRFGAYSLAALLLLTLLPQEASARWQCDGRVCQWIAEEKPVAKSTAQIAHGIPAATCKAKSCCRAARERASRTRRHVCRRILRRRI